MTSRAKLAALRAQAAVTYATARRAHRGQRRAGEALQDITTRLLKAELREGRKPVAARPSAAPDLFSQEAHP
jgi:hypothetical protein